MGEDKLRLCGTLHRIQPGRPKKVRTMGPDESVNPYRRRKGGVRMRCGK